MSATSNLPQFVLVTDRGLLQPTLFVARGILKHLSGPGVLHFWGDGLSEADWEAVRRIATTNPAVRLECLALKPEDLAGATSPTEHISAAAMGRLFIASRIDGRVLYIDGDTRVTADLSPLFTLDLEGKPIGAVRDYVVSKWCARGIASDRNNAPRIAEIRKLMGQNDISGYFNSGVLLIDTAAVRARPDLAQAMQDIVRASACPWGDQDHLNNVFRGEVHLMNPCWNASWSRTAEHRGFIRKLGGSPEELASLPDAIVHFHGPKKPWKAPRKDFWSRRARAVMAYRRELRGYSAEFPDLAF